MQNLKILILKNEKILVTEVHEVESELGEPDCKLVNPCEMFVSSKDVWEMKTWPCFTNQRELKIHSDSIFSIVDPTPEQIQLYIETIK
jgi:hypothetical protein